MEDPVVVDSLESVQSAEPWDLPSRMVPQSVRPASAIHGVGVQLKQGKIEAPFVSKTVESVASERCRL